MTLTREVVYYYTMTFTSEIVQEEVELTERRAPAERLQAARDLVRVWGGRSRGRVRVRVRVTDWCHD